MQFCCFSFFMIKITVVITSLITDGEGVEAVTSLKYRRTGRVESVAKNNLNFTRATLHVH